MVKEEKKRSVKEGIDNYIGSYIIHRFPIFLFLYFLSFRSSGASLLLKRITPNTFFFG